jgi:hypothetical protein
MTGAVDKTYFRELAEQDPAAVCRRVPGCRYDAGCRCYTLPVWGEEYVICPHEKNVERTGVFSSEPHELFYFFIVYYLLRADGMQASGLWVSEKDIPGGTTFFRGPHEIPTRLISRRYGNRIEDFRNRCGRLHGTPLDMGDVAFWFEIAPGVHVAVLYWIGDDDFPAEAKVLYDKTITDRLPPDVVFSLAVEVCIRIAEGGTI